MKTRTLDKNNKWVHSLRSSNLFIWILFLNVLVLPFIQVTTFWLYGGSEVDESELVYFGLGFLGGDLDPVWDGYGHLAMYLLGACYFAIGSLSVLFGDAASLVDYAADHLFSGHFFIVARIFMAICGMLAIALCATLLRDFSRNTVLSLLFVAIVAFSSKAHEYANYVRSDTLVVLFSVSVLFYISRARNFKGYSLVAIFSAAAVACKVSALPILGVLTLFVLWLWYSERIGSLQVLLLISGFFVVLKLLSPHMDYAGLINAIFLAEYSASGTHLSRVEYSGYLVRLSKIIEFHYQALGWFFGALACASVIGVWSKYSALVLWSWLIICLTISPYLLGLTLRDYWFLSSYLLCMLLAFISLSIAVDLIQTRFSTMLSKLVGILLASAIVVLTAKAVLNSADRFIASFDTEKVTNIAAAKEWLERGHLGTNSILVDITYAYLYPKVYDPLHLAQARSTSGLFTYERENNVFLNSAFEKYLYEKYLRGGDNHSLLKPKLAQVRVDLASDDGSVVTIPEICSKFSMKCFRTELVALNDLKIQRREGSILYVDVLGEDPYLVFAVGRSVPIDGSFYVDVKNDSSRWQLFFDYGQGFSQSHTTKFHSENVKVSIIDAQSKPWVSWFGPHEKIQDRVRETNPVLYVTSDWTYNRIKRIASTSKDQNKVAKANFLVSRYDEIRKTSVDKRFGDAGSKNVAIFSIGREVRGSLN
jgi:uncharacterized protein (UPF0276 family)